MPSELRNADEAARALAAVWTPFREAAALAADETAALVSSARASASAERIPGFAASLGQLGAGRFEVGKLATVLATDRALPSGASLDAVEAAGVVLREAAGGAPHPVVRLRSGEDLVGAIERELARIGRVFGAAHVVALARTGRYQRSEHEPWLGSYPFAKWNRRERLLAPPIVVELDGADLRAGGLAGLLDGGVRIALVVRDEDAPPAPLVRLVAPRVLVIQSTDGAALTQLAAFAGPGVLAWVPETCAAFVHDPAAGSTVASRLRVTSTPALPRRGLAGLSAMQLADEIGQLEALGGLGAGTPVATGESANPVDRLAAWILSQSDISGASEAAS